jgi:DNA-binding MarR family transcriptional regulator
MAAAASRKNGAKDRRMLEVLEQFRIIFRSIKRHYQSVEQRAGVSGAQLWALSQVASRPGMQVGELARALAIHQSTASNLLRGLEELALVSRVRQGADQRTVQLVTTAKGRAVLKRAPQPLIGVLQQALSELSARDLERLHRELGHLVAWLKRQGAAAPPEPISELYKSERKRSQRREVQP